MELKAEPVLMAKASLGEGAIWDSENAVLHWVDINNCEIHTFDPDTTSDTMMGVGEKIGTVVKRKQGGFVAALPAKFVHVSETGLVSVLAEIPEEKVFPNLRLNDGKCDPSGRLWCGSMDHDFKAEAGNLWMLDTCLKVHRKIERVTISNGIVWTSDQKTMYYIDSGKNTVDAFDFDVTAGSITNRRTVVKNEWGGFLDGMTIDRDDNLYIAAWAGGAVYIVDPRKAQLLGEIEVPGVKNVTSCAFGGNQLQDLYITSSAENTMPDAEPNAGALFHVRVSNTCGVPAFEFSG